MGGRVAWVRTGCTGPGMGSGLQPERPFATTATAPFQPLVFPLEFRHCSASQ
ncbi:hypothetical protein [Lysobacter gummosus]|uniref:hypothetical protein n=1 Tax=Lysobacter gummosus TaxID=262324 RepID=UPI003624BA00